MENTQQENQSFNDHVTMAGQQNAETNTGASPSKEALRTFAERKGGETKKNQKNKTQRSQTPQKPLKEEEKDDTPKWYSLRVISGKEKKIQERIEKEVENNEEWKSFISKVIVPTEKVYKVRNGKKVMQERNLLPGYILIEAIGSKLKGDVAKLIADIPNVIHFLGKENPLPMTQAEANRLLGVVDESAEIGETLSEPFLVNETVKIIDGPFAEFVGDVKEVNEEKKKLKVIVKIFGRGTEVELNFLQVEKIS